MNFVHKWYDIYEDWDLIESSFQEQYGIDLSTDSVWDEQDLTWSKF